MDAVTGRPWLPSTFPVRELQLALTRWLRAEPGTDEFREAFVQLRRAAHGGLENPAHPGYATFTVNAHKRIVWNPPIQGIAWGGNQQGQGHQQGQGQGQGNQQGRGPRSSKRSRGIIKMF